MKIKHLIAVAGFIAFSAPTVYAQNTDQHKDHHPAPAVTQGDAAKVNPAQGQMQQEMMKKMDDQMKVMQEIHQKMMNAKSPEERQAIMIESMKAMEGGMSMIRDAEMMNMPMKEGMAMKDGMPMNNGMQMKEGMHLQHQMMQKRMDMMTSMMQMMMDRIGNSQSK